MDAPIIRYTAGLPALQGRAGSTDWHDNVWFELQTDIDAPVLPILVHPGESRRDHVSQAGLPACLLQPRARAGCLDMPDSAMGGFRSAPGLDYNCTAAGEGLERAGAEGNAEAGHGRFGSAQQALIAFFRTAGAIQSKQKMRVPWRPNFPGQE